MAPSAAVEWLDPDQSYVEVRCPKIKKYQNISINATISLEISLPYHWTFQIRSPIKRHQLATRNRVFG